MVKKKTKGTVYFDDKVVGEYEIEYEDESRTSRAPSTERRAVSGLIYIDNFIIGDFKIEYEDIIAFETGGRRIAKMRGDVIVE